MVLLQIPPAPPRPDFDASREKLQKLGEGEGSMTKEEFTKMKQELEAYVIFVVAFVNCACFNSFFCALWYPILLIISPQWPFLKDAGLSQTTSFNDHDQSLQENYRIIVCIVKFFNVLNRLWKLKTEDPKLYLKIVEREIRLFKAECNLLCFLFIRF